MSSSTLVSIVTPHTAGGFQITDLTNLQTGGTALSWGFTRIDSPAENTNADYLFFAPNNAGSYTPFNIPANTTIDLFSFKSGSGCLGNIALFDNDNDPLNANSGINPDNNFVVLGGGVSSLYTSNTSGNVPCSIPTTTEVVLCINYDETTQTYTVSMESNEAYTGGLARLSSSTLASVVFPHTAGGYQITNLTGSQAGATPLAWGFTRIDAPAENPNADYLFFNPSNAGSYTPFDIPANTPIDLFSFQSASGCNTDDPLNANTGVNPDNSISILGAGIGNKYLSNCNTGVSCTVACEAESGTLGY